MILPLPHDNQYLFLDMNSFFASCEQHLHPELRGKPVGVSPTSADSGCILAASYEAKKYGIKTGTRVGEAKQKLPSIIIVDTTPRQYTQIHDRIYQFLLEEIGPDVKSMSIDEFIVPLDKREQETLHAHHLALFIKQRIQEIFSPALRCSIGIGPNAFLAKLGTELQKPDGLAFIQLHTLPLAFTQLELRDIPGINWGMSYRLMSMGIHTPEEFYAAPRSLLHEAWGILGDSWWYNLHGYKVTYAAEKTKSISHSHVLAPVYRNKPKARAVLYKLCFKIADRLRHKKLCAATFFVTVKAKGERYDFPVVLRATQDPFAFFDPIAKVYDNLPSTLQPYQLRVVAWNLTPNVTQKLNLFVQDSRKTKPLLESVDKMNAKFGRWTVKPASLVDISDAAPNRITFRPPDYEMD